MSEIEKLKILYIDDEINNLNSFKATFRHDYNVLIAHSAEDGMQVVEDNPDLKVIFCDQRMPGKTGVQFFEEVSLKFPGPIRMLITGYIDIESVIKAINKGHIYRYLTKPWREEEVRSAIEEGNKYYTTTTLLKSKIQELQEINSELDKFTYSVTHDIRGPIVSILGALQILDGMDDISEIKKLARMMLHSTEKVKDLISNIQAYYNIKRGNLNIKEVNFQDFLDELLVLHYIDVTQVKIKCEVVQEEVFRSDLSILQLIFNNLLTNAIKYQRREEASKYIGIFVKVENGVAEIIMDDNGIGIDPQYIEKIFDMFFRATQESVGSGFGLFNVKDALQKLQGTIQVDSVVGQGTKFILSIPSM